jgi:hypothetical protein
MSKPTTSTEITDVIVAACVVIIVLMALLLIVSYLIVGHLN